jgi:hypothetical protein
MRVLEKPNFSNKQGGKCTHTIRSQKTQAIINQCKTRSEGACCGWIEVRHVKVKNGKWHPARDQLKGTEAYGIPFNDKNNWSIRFSHMTFNQFLFTSGDGKYWLVADKDQVTGGWYSNAHRNIVKSSRHSGASRARWYRRSGSYEDPWVSLGDHADQILYGENSHGSYTQFVQNNGGAKVYIRQAPPRSDDTDACLKPPVQEDCVWNS